MRETADFNGARLMLEAIPAEKLDVITPKEVKDRDGNATNWAEIDDAEQRQGWRTYIEALKAVVARGDSSVEPLDMLPVEIAAGLCIDSENGSLTPAGYCERLEVSAKVDQFRKARAEVEADPSTPETH